MNQKSKWAKSGNKPMSNMSYCCLPTERVEPNSEQQERSKCQGQMPEGSKWAKSQNGLRLKTGCCCLCSERVKLAMKSKKETNDTVKMGQESRWTIVVYPLKESR